MKIKYIKTLAIYSNLPEIIQSHSHLFLNNIPKARAKFPTGHLAVFEY